MALRLLLSSNKANAGHAAPSDGAEEESLRKRLKTAPTKRSQTSNAKSTETSTTVLTYSLVGEEQFLKFQLKATDTLYDLCDLVCNEWMATFREEDCGVDEHLWHFRDSASGKVYKKINDWDYSFQDLVYPLTHLLNHGHTVGSELFLTYDYGTTTETTLRLESITEDANLAATCPKRFVLPPPPNFRVHHIPEGLPTVDELYPLLSKALFDTTWSHQPGQISLFRPGRKHHQAFCSTRSMTQILIWIPEPLRMDEKSSSVEELLAALEYGYSLGPLSDYEYTWVDRVIVPCEEHLNDRAVERLDRLEEHECPIYEFSASASVKQPMKGYFARAFPKCRKAYTSSKSRERGWITYEMGVLNVCHGDSQKIAHGTKPDVFLAADSYKPLAKSIVGSIQTEIKSLHDLFCHAEALWP